jgi:hypothetical protein
LCCSKNRDTNTFEVNFKNTIIGHGTLLMIEVDNESPEEEIKI